MSIFVFDLVQANLLIFLFYFKNTGYAVHTRYKECCHVMSTAIPHCIALTRVKENATVLFSQALTASPCCHFRGILLDLLWYFALQYYFDSVLFCSCHVWIRSICHQLKGFSFLLSGFWLLLKSRPKHCVTQQGLRWKFLLEPALSYLTVGIVLG